MRKTVAAEGAEPHAGRGPGTARTVKGRMKSTSKEIRVFLLDDHRLVLDGLERLLDSTPDIRVCGKACTMAEARGLLPAARPDVLVADLSLPDGNGLDLLDDAAVREINCPVLVLSMRDEGFYAPRAVERGARGFVSKGSSSDEMLSAIRTVHAGNIHVSAAVATALIERVTRGGKPDAEAPGSVGAVETVLGAREMTVFELIGRGCATKEIAGLLHISPKTVDTHRQRIRQKLRIPSAARLTALAILWASNQSGATPKP
jgi:DNA-binding NarL/FixJ family response regulator